MEFEDNPVVVFRELEIIFQVGEHPTLPHVGWRFSSKVSGSCGASEPYIIRVCGIARVNFGHRVKAWGYDELGYYGWNEVYATWKEYIQSTYAGTELEYYQSCC
jgi:hypothetical protein